MPRKTFIADVEAVAQQRIPGISQVARGNDDNEVVLIFVPTNGSPIEITLIAQPDVGSYPSESMFMAFTNGTDVPEAATAAIEEVAGISFGVRLPDLIITISQKLQRALATGSREDPVSLDGSDVEMIDPDDEPEQSDAESDVTEEFGGFSSDEDGFHGASRSNTNARHHDPVASKKLDKRIRHDIRMAKVAGFRCGVLSGMKSDSIDSMLSLSKRVAKLGLSEEAIQAWDLEPHQYIVLLVRYTDGYKSLDVIKDLPAKSAGVTFRVGVSNRYKPTLVEALAAFADSNKKRTKPSEQVDENSELTEKTKAGFSNMFISSSLNEFVNEQFVSLLKVRISLEKDWSGAKDFLYEKQGRLNLASEELPATHNGKSSTKKNVPSKDVAGDHLTDKKVEEKSFPLVAAQFVLRYLTRCTEFCLVCHNEIREDFEALKPYVCSSPLCLYQYMSLGFGPSVEHEILTQPYVVDLLVSFCYAAAKARRLREYPTGMSLMVPPITQKVTAESSHGHQYSLLQTSTPKETVEPGNEISLPRLSASYDANHQELIFDSSTPSCPVRNTEWVVVAGEGFHQEHFRVEDVSLFPTVKLSSTPVIRATTYTGPLLETTPNLQTPAMTPATTPSPVPIAAVNVDIYNQNFDDIGDIDKAETIVMLLETLPSVEDMRHYLIQQSKYTEPNLKAWTSRVSPAAMGMLRWIIASNRSCIVQVDRYPGQTDADVIMSKARLDQRVSHVAENFVQFRFAQGSPDKEQRFLDALRAQQNSLNSKYPTLWAWHGSGLSNWHSIIRAGLDFKETLHGRAYGHGVYHAKDQSTSVGYSQAHMGDLIWHGSQLRITTAMSLNEIVNCPTQFTSSNPYLVVQFIDWIQCRYLFVQTRSPGSSTISTASVPTTSVPTASVLEDPEVIEQDPHYVATSTKNQKVGIPVCAASISRGFRKSRGDSPLPKRQKQGNPDDLFKKTLDSESDSTSDEVFPLSDVETSSEVEDKVAEGRRTTQFVHHTRHLFQRCVISTKADRSSSLPPQKSLTDFVPGSLDQSTLPMLEPPSYATPSATRTLNRALKDILEIQKKTPLNELGWYVNQELISNIYQWIVELHTFDSSLPLAQDMKAAGITSIVLEIRFGQDFPYSPPFVRVIRPRFLPFTSGGGGHVTGGGAMCMELLTNTGWSSVSSIESIILQVRVAIMNLEPKPARLLNRSPRKAGYNDDYQTGEAIDAYERACRTHGWKIPPGLREWTLGAGKAGASGV